MAFNFNGIGNSALHPMMSLMASGGSFLPSLNTPPNIQQLPGQPLLSGLTGGLNDHPLEFNIKKSHYPVPTSEHDGINDNRDCDIRLLTRMDSRDRDKNIDRRGDEVSPNSSLESQDKNVQSMNNLGLSQNTDHLMFNGVIPMPSNYMLMSNMLNMVDPSLINMQQYPLLNQSSTSAGDSNPSTSNSTPTKEIIQCKLSSLFPPNPKAPPPTTRERPPGCRTVFVGGLPEKITEEIIREVFERCGEITTLRLSKKNFCHIRFAYEGSVDSAIYLSGYRIRIGNNTDQTNCGRLHVDFAQAREDQYDWECKQRQIQREQRHRERMERDRMRPSSPPPIVHYTELEATSVADKLKQDDTFCKAVQTLITWLERGDCNKKNSNTFYALIQGTNSHVRKLLNEKSTFDEELRKAKESYRNQMRIMATQFTQIDKVFNAASHKKVWDHFTKAQRKNIDMWKRQSTEIKSVNQDVLQPDGDEMEMSDDDYDPSEPSNKKPKLDVDALKEDNDSLRCQLAAVRTEIDLVKSDLKSDVDFKEQQIKVLQETIRNLQTQLLEKNVKALDGTKTVEQAEFKELNNKFTIEPNEIITLDDDNDVKESSNVVNERRRHHVIEYDDAKIIGLVSTFLVVHPFGASTDYIWSYVTRLAPQIRPKELEEILGRYKCLFLEEITGIGAKIEHKWKFCGFNCNGETVTKN